MKVELWLARLDFLPEEDGRFLSEEEHARAARFIHQKYRTHFINRRSILRKLLGNYLNINPGEIIIKMTELGKPYVETNDNLIFFNTSHSKDHVLYGFSREAELGIDIEFLDDEIEAELISSHFFSPEEISLIKNALGRSQVEAFFRHWCIKEAYIKLIGKGLTYPLDQVLVTDVWNNPVLAIPNQNSTSNSSNILQVLYSDWAKDYGIGVAVSGGSKLQVSFRIYERL